MVPQSRAVRALVVLVGALLGGVFAALVSVWLPNPYPMAFGIALAVPVMDVGLHPQNVPDDPGDVATVGVLAALGGIVVGGAVGVLWTTLSLPWPLAVTLGSTYLATEATGRVALSRLN